MRAHRDDPRAGRQAVRCPALPPHHRGLPESLSARGDSRRNGLRAQSGNIKWDTIARPARAIESGSPAWSPRFEANNSRRHSPRTEVSVCPRGVDRGRTAERFLRRGCAGRSRSPRDRLCRGKPPDQPLRDGLLTQELAPGATASFASAWSGGARACSTVPITLRGRDTVADHLRARDFRGSVPFALDATRRR